MIQQNSKCRLYVDRNETINRIVKKCGKLGQKLYIRLDTTGWEGAPPGTVQKN